MLATQFVQANKTNSSSKKANAAHSSRHTKDIFFGLFIVAPLLVVGLIALLHTVTLAIYYGGPFVLQLLLPVIAVVLSISLIVQKNAIHSLLCLMGVFLATAGIYFSIGASYFALVFLLIGQGAVAILFLYAVILLPLRALKNPVERLKDSKQVFAVTVGVAALAHLVIELSASFTQFFERNQVLLARIEPTTSEVVRQYANVSANDILAFKSLYLENSALFMLITLILLAAMLGAIILATTSSNERA